MALTKERKQELLAEYADLLAHSKALIITEYRGLNNVELTKLRRAVREADGVYRVTKVTLLKRALQAHNLPVPDELLDVPVAMAFCFSEVPGLAKVLTDYAAGSEFVAVRGALLEGRLISADDVKALADLPPLDVLRAQIIGLLSSPASNLAGVINAGVSQLVNVLHAYAEQGEGAAAG